MTLVRRWVRVVSIAVFVAAQGFGCEGREDGALPPLDHVLLITIDTLRADHLGAYGFADADTPIFDALAQRGALFENAYTTCNVTGPSHASIMTGLFPQRHGMLGNAWRLDPSIPKLATLLSSAGFQTAAFVSTAVLASASGLNHGFDHYDQAFLRDVEFERTLQRRGDRTVDAALAWLERPPEGRLFVWLHLFDPHAPYDPPESFWPADRPRPDTQLATLDAIYSGAIEISAETAEAIRELYHAEVRFVDRQLARVLSRLEATGLSPRTLVILTADHGEELGQHMRFFEHIRSLYQGVIRVPLIVADPGLGVAPQRIAEPVQVLDVAATILERMGVAPPADLDARSLVPLLRGTEGAPHRGFVLAQRPPHPGLFRRGDAFAWVHAGQKVIVYQYGPSELYDLASDPHESRDLGSDRRAVDALRQQLVDTVAALRERSLAPPARRVTVGEQRARLRALGYLTGDAGTPVPGAEQERE